MSQRTPTDHEINILASEFILHGDQVRAWRLAFPDSKANLDAQYVNASRAFADPKLRLRIMELQDLSKKQSEEEFTMTVAELKKVLAKVMKQGVNNGKLAAVVSAVATFNKMDGNDAPVKQEHVMEVTRKVIRVRTKKVDKPDNDE